MTSISVIMPGARMHYAVPKILAEHNLLAKFYTDLFLTPTEARILGGVQRILRNPGVLKYANRRYNPQLPQDRVEDSRRLALHYFLGRHRVSGNADPVRSHLEFSEKFTRSCVSRIQECAALYMYNSTALEIMRDRLRCPKQPLFVLEQCIAPRAEEIATLMQAHQVYPTLYGEHIVSQSWRDYAEREMEEWELADIVIAPSQYVAGAIKRHAASNKRIEVIPYGVDWEGAAGNSSRKACEAGAGEDRARKKLDLVFVGQFGLRKGAPLLLRLAKEFHKYITITIVGDVSLNANQLVHLPENLVFKGRLDQEQVRMQMESADALVLPSLCEGSATVTYEAFRLGIPVICSVQTGAFAEDGSYGRVFDFFDYSQLTGAIEDVLYDRKLIANWRVRIAADSSRWSLHRYETELLSLLERSLQINP